MEPGKEFTLNMGYRIYENAEATRSKFHRDYEGVSFKLLDTVYKPVKKTKASEKSKKA